MTSIAAIHFSYGSIIISWKQLKPSIITSSLWLIQQNLKVPLFGESHCSPALLKVPIYATELVV